MFKRSYLGYFPYSPNIFKSSAQILDLPFSPPLCVCFFRICTRRLVSKIAFGNLSWMSVSSYSAGFFCLCRIRPAALSGSLTREPFLQAYLVNTSGWNRTDRLNQGACRVNSYLVDAQIIKMPAWLNSVEMFLTRFQFTACLCICQKYCFDFALTPVWMKTTTLDSKASKRSSQQKPGLLRYSGVNQVLRVRR